MLKHVFERSKLYKNWTYLAIATCDQKIHDFSKENTEQKEIMTNLLESVDTGKLRKQFDKYMPSVINGRSPAKKASSTIGTEVTGDKQINIVNGSQFNSNIVDIRRLAGI